MPLKKSSKTSPSSAHPRHLSWHPILSTLKRLSLRLPKNNFRPRLFTLICLALTLLISVPLFWTLYHLPSPASLSSSDIAPQSSLIYDRHRQLLYELYTEKRRTPVPLDQVPQDLINATLAIEDANFYHHFGLDFRGIARGLIRTIFQGRLQGGSTITQQLVKNALLTQERTISRKVKEMLLTIAVELIYPKDKILEMYFNQTPYGGTLWGVDAAARGIFGKSVSDLNLAESSMIAGLPGSPSRYSPFSNPEAAKNRQIMVLDRMLELKMISPEQKNQAVDTKLTYNLSPNRIFAPHFVFYVRDQIIDKYDPVLIKNGGLQIHTTLDLDLQNAVQNIIATEVAKLSRSQISNGAALVTEPKTGEILAMVGSVDYFAETIDGKYNVTTASRQPGSSIKPITYSVALELGKVTAASLYADQPTCFSVSGQPKYCPTNYGGRYFGLQSLRQSLANSLNIPAVKTIDLVGVETFIASASAFGIDSFQKSSDYGLSITLGGGEVPMTQMATAFGVIANMGLRQDLVSIRSITGPNSETIVENQLIPGIRVISRETAYIIYDILRDDAARSMVFGSGSQLNIKGHPEVAVKTGTTNEMRDNWTIGFNHQYVVASWVGNNNNTKMGYLVSGTTGAAPIWNKIFTHLLTDQPVYKPPIPNSILHYRVCDSDGRSAEGQDCSSHYEYFLPKYRPTPAVVESRQVLVDRDTNRLAPADSTSPNLEWQTKQILLDVHNDQFCLDCSPPQP